MVEVGRNHSHCIHKDTFHIPHQLLPSLFGIGYTCNSQYPSYIPSMRMSHYLRNTLTDCSLLRVHRCPGLNVCLLGYYNTMKLACHLSADSSRRGRSMKELGEGLRKLTRRLHPNLISPHVLLWRGEQLLEELYGSWLGELYGKRIRIWFQETFLRDREGHSRL